MSLEEGLKALQQQNYGEAVQFLEDYCQQSADVQSAFYLQGKIALARAYRGNNQRQDALELGTELEAHLDREVSRWAQGFLSILDAEEKSSGMDSIGKTNKRMERAGRSLETGVRLSKQGKGGNLWLATLGTMLLLFAIVFAFFLALCLLINSSVLVPGLIIAAVLSLIFYGVLFLISPWLIDSLQSQLHQIRWVNLAEIKRLSPESASVIQRVCREKSLKPPKLGIVDDPNPTAFTYGSFPGPARLVVSQGLFACLDDDEVATVYAHELSHIVYSDLALMTIGSIFSQLPYFLSVSAWRKSHSLPKNWQPLARLGAIAADILYELATYPLLHLSRTREYFADHSAAQTTGNPNGLSRALVKIAAGILQESKQTEQPSRLLASTRTLAIYDPRLASVAGSAYQITTEGRKLSQVFLWDVFNPWSDWMELHSTHPLTGKRLRMLAKYAQQLNLDIQFDLAEVLQEGEKLDKKRLRGTFILEMLVFTAPIWGTIMGLLMAWLFIKKGDLGRAFWAFGLMGLGLGTLVRLLSRYPSLRSARSADIFSLMSDPYISSLAGCPVQLKGKLVGTDREMRLQDRTGQIFVSYSSPWQQIQPLLPEEVRVGGWFRRGATVWLDLREITQKNLAVRGDSRLWPTVFALVATAIGFCLWRF